MTTTAPDKRRMSDSGNSAHESKNPNNSTSGEGKMAASEPVDLQPDSSEAPKDSQKFNQFTKDSFAIGVPAQDAAEKSATTRKRSGNGRNSHSDKEGTGSFHDPLGIPPKGDIGDNLDTNKELLDKGPNQNEKMEGDEGPPAHPKNLFGTPPAIPPDKPPNDPNKEDTNSSTAGDPPRHPDGVVNFPPGPSPAGGNESEPKPVLDLGIRLTRMGNHGSTAFEPSDLQQLLMAISEVDAQATIRNHASNPQTTKLPSDFASDNNTNNTYKLYMDHQTQPWGKPAAKRERSQLSFYIQSTVIRPGLKELRKNPTIEKYLEISGCTMDSHELHQTTSKVIGYFSGKDPKHTYRKELASRLMTHLQTHNQQQVIPAQVILARVLVNKSYVRMCALTVGDDDSQTASSILQEHSPPLLDILHHSWIRSNPEQFNGRIQEHTHLIANSRAFRINHMDAHQLAQFRTAAMKIPHIIDVPTASHFESTGAVYAQYLQSERANVLNWIESSLQTLPTSPHDSKFSSGPTIANSGNSVTMTRATNATQTPAGANKQGRQAPAQIYIPQSRFHDFLSTLPQEDKDAAFHNHTVPKGDTTSKPKSYRDAAAPSRSPSGSAVSSISGTQQTPTRSNRSTAAVSIATKAEKDLKEAKKEMAALRSDNQTLKEQLNKQDQMLKDIMSQLKEMKLAKHGLPPPSNTGPPNSSDLKKHKAPPPQAAAPGATPTPPRQTKRSNTQSTPAQFAQGMAQDQSDSPLNHHYHTPSGHATPTKFPQPPTNPKQGLGGSQS